MKGVSSRGGYGVREQAPLLVARLFTWMFKPRPLREGQKHGDGRARIGDAGQSQRATVGYGDATSDREAEAGATCLPRARFFHPVEAFSHLFKMFVLVSYTLIAYLEQRLSLLYRRANLYLTPGTIVFDSV